MNCVIPILENEARNKKKKKAKTKGYAKKKKNGIRCYLRMKIT